MPDEKIRYIPYYKRDGFCFKPNEDLSRNCLLDNGHSGECCWDEKKEECNLCGMELGEDFRLDKDGLKRCSYDERNVCAMQQSVNTLDEQ